MTPIAARQDLRVLLELSDVCAAILCGMDETCVDGACRPVVASTSDAGTPDAGTSCAATCAGCCEGEVCETGTEPAACGAGGRSCFACPAGFGCSEGLCTLSPSSRWAIVLEHLDVPATTVSGVRWDETSCTFAGEQYCPPDPYVEVYVGVGATMPRATTMFVDDTTSVNFTPPFVVEPVVASDVSGFLRFRVLDDDTGGAEQIGACEVTGLTASSFAGLPIETTCPPDAATDNHGFTLRWHFEPR